MVVTDRIYHLAPLYSDLRRQDFLCSMGILPMQHPRASPKGAPFSRQIMMNPAPRSFRRRPSAGKIILRWAGYSFLLLGVVVLGYCVWVQADTFAFQAYQSWRLDQLQERQACQRCTLREAMDPGSVGDRCTRSRRRLHRWRLWQTPLLLMDLPLRLLLLMDHRLLRGLRDRRRLRRPLVRRCTRER